MQPIHLLSIPAWLQLFYTEVRQTGILEWLGVGFGVAEVLLARANRVGLYPAGIISVLISTYIFYTAGLYAESLLNIYYLVMSVYGWWVWIRRDNHEPPLITRCDTKDWTVTVIHRR